MNSDPVFLSQVAELLQAAGLTLGQAYAQGLPRPDLIAKPECWSASVFYGWAQKWLDERVEHNAKETARLAVEEARLRAKHRP